MIESSKRPLETTTRRWHKVSLWLTTWTALLIARWASCQIVADVRAQARELWAMCMASLPGDRGPSPVDHRHTSALPPSLTSHSVTPRADFTASVMSRVRALPSPAAPTAAPLAALSAATPRQRSSWHLFGVVCLALGLAGLPLALGFTIALIKPALALLVIGLFIDAFVLLLAMIHVIIWFATQLSSHLWLSVPLLVALLSVILLTWSRVQHVFTFLPLEA